MLQSDNYTNLRARDAARVLPIFALQSVLLPGAPLPLHIFEQRYRRMVADLAARARDEPREFVVLAIREGDEVLERPDGAAQAPVTYDVGTIARVTSLRHLPDGRSILLCKGTERVRLLERTQDEPYPAGRFMTVPDTTEADADARAVTLVSGAQAALRELFEAIRRVLPGQRADQRHEIERALASIPTEAADLSYFAARVLSTVSNEEKQRFLEAPGPLARLQLIQPVLLLEARLAQQRGSSTRTSLN